MNYNDNKQLRHATSGPGVGLLVGSTHMVGRDVRVDFGGGDVGVTEHGLDAAQVGPSLEQVRRERMSELVRGDRRGDAHPSGVAHHEFPKTLPRERLAPRREEKRGTTAPRLA